MTTFGHVAFPTRFNTRQVNSITDTFLLLLLFFSLLGIAIWHKRMQENDQRDNDIIQLTQVKGIAFFRFCFQLYFLLIVWAIAIIGIAGIILFQVWMKNDLLFVLFVAIASIGGAFYVVYSSIENDIRQKLAYALTHLV